MRRGPGWEAQVARGERRALRLAVGAVPLTLAERRPLEFLVDKGSHGVAAEELREACGYLVLHPLRVRLRRLIRSGHVVENVGNGFAITPSGLAALRGSRPSAEDPAGGLVDLRYLTPSEHRMLQALRALPDARRWLVDSPVKGTHFRAEKGPTWSGSLVLVEIVHGGGPGGCCTWKRGR